MWWLFWCFYKRSEASIVENFLSKTTTTATSEDDLWSFSKQNILNNILFYMKIEIRVLLNNRNNDSDKSHYYRQFSWVNCVIFFSNKIFQIGNRLIVGEKAIFSTEYLQSIKALFRSIQQLMMILFAYLFLQYGYTD